MLPSRMSMFGHRYIVHKPSHSQARSEVLVAAASDVDEKALVKRSGKRYNPIWRGGRPEHPRPMPEGTTLRPCSFVDGVARAVSPTHWWHHCCAGRARCRRQEVATGAQCGAQACGQMRGK